MGNSNLADANENRRGEIMTYQEKKAKKKLWEEYLKECQEELNEEKRREKLGDCNE